MLKWDLSNLFGNNHEFYAEIEDIKKLLIDVKKYENMELDEYLFLEMLTEKDKIRNLTNNVLIYGSFMYYKNVKSDECIELKSAAEAFNNQVNSELSFVDRKILSLGREKVNDFIIKNDKIKVYQLFLDNLFRMQEHVQDSDTDVIIKGNIDSINSYLRLYNDTLRDIKYGEIQIDGKLVEITSSNFAKYLSSRDRDTRRQAYLVVNQKFKNLEETFANILDLIIGYRIKNAKLEKYNSVLEKILFEENIDSMIVESIINAVNNNVDLIQRYLKIKSDLLDISKPHLYDFGVPLDNNLKIKYSFEEAIEIIKNALEPLGSEYLQVVECLLNGHIDAEPDDNKHQFITFSWNTYSFMNFRGAYVDLKNMIHELGHIVNYYLSKKNLPFIYEDSTVFVGETASIVNEILLNRYLYKNAVSLEEKMFYLSKEIENYFTTVFKQTMYTEFENQLYSVKMSDNLTAEILSEKYGNLIRKYYGDNIVYDEISNIEWTRLGHLYRWSYYPYKYASGLIIASVVVNSLLDEHSLSKEKYLEFLSSGSSLYSLDLLKMLDIDLTSSNIIDNGFKVLESDIEELEKTLKLKNKKI